MVLSHVYTSRRLTEKRMRYYNYIDLVEINTVIELAMLRSMRGDGLPWLLLLLHRLIPTLRLSIDHHYSLEDS